jgi:hypothetical protein
LLLESFVNNLDKNIFRQMLGYSKEVHIQLSEQGKSKFIKMPYPVTFFPGRTGEVSYRHSILG